METGRTSRHYMPFSWWWHECLFYDVSVYIFTFYALFCMCCISSKNKMLKKRKKTQRKKKMPCTPPRMIPGLLWLSCSFTFWLCILDFSHPLSIPGNKALPCCPRLGMWFHAAWWWRTVTAQAYYLLSTGADLRSFASTQKNLKNHHFRELLDWDLGVSFRRVWLFVYRFAI